MKTTFTTFIFTISILFGFQIAFAQNSENQLVKYKSKPISKNAAFLTDTVDFNLYKMGAVAPNYLTPVSQVEEMTFGSWIQSTSDTIVDYFIYDFHIYEDNSGNEVFSDSFIYEGDIGVGFCDPCLIPDKYIPPFEVKSYTGYYHVTSNIEEINTLNNYDTIKFATSDLTFAKENGGTQTIVPDESSWDENEHHSWAYGNSFHLVDENGFGKPPNVFATFSIGNANDPNLSGKLISIYLYEWNNDTNQDGNMAPEERTAIGFNIYEILGTEQTTDLISVPLLIFPYGESGSLNLKSDQTYVLMIEYAANDQVDLALVASTEFDYTTTILITEQQGMPRYAALLGVDEWIETKPLWIANP